MQILEDKKKRRILMAIVIFALGVVALVSKNLKGYEISIPKQASEVKVLYNYKEAQASVEDAKAMIDFFNGLEIKETEKKDELSDKEYLGSFKIFFMEDGNSKEILYLLKNNSIYDPSERVTFSLSESQAKKIRKLVEKYQGQELVD